MGRPPLPVGTWGNITTSRTGTGWRARTHFRDFDGVTRRVERNGRTAGAARNALTAYLSERSAPAGDDITGTTRLSELAEVWFAENQDRWAVNTVRRYRDTLEDHVLAGVGNLLVREATVSRLDRFLKATSEQTGPATAKSCRAVLSGMMALAVRHDAIRSNPLRDVAGITVTPKDEARAMTVDEVQAVRRTVAAWIVGAPTPDGRPRRGRPPADDLLDIVDVLVATGLRIGELLAVRWCDVDLDAGTLDVNGTIVMSDAKPSRPMRQDKPKSDRSRRRLVLPAFAVDALLRRRVAITAANVHDVVFPSAAGTLRDPGNVRKQLNKVLAEVGMTWVTPKTFRKTVATVIAHEGSLRDAAGQLGHASDDVTRRHYVQRRHDAPDSRVVLDRFAPDA